MLENLKNAFDKFKNDILPKSFYDIFKGLVIYLTLLALPTIIPHDTPFGEVINKTITLRIYSIFLIGIVLIIITYISSRYIFNIKYKILQKDNYTDSSTGLKNEKALKSYLNKKINEVKQTNNPLSIILIDIDDFGNFNENFNQTTGDKILTEVGRLLLKDSRITDETFRQYSRGDEFVVVSSQTNITEVRFAADRKREFIKNATFIIDDKPYKLTVCCGLSEYRQGDTFESILARANYAVRNIAKKKLGKNCTEHVV